VYWFIYINKNGYFRLLLGGFFRIDFGVVPIAPGFVTKTPGLKAALFTIGWIDRAGLFLGLVRANSALLFVILCKEIVSTYIVTRGTTQHTTDAYKLAFPRLHAYNWILARFQTDLTHTCLSHKTFGNITVCSEMKALYNSMPLYTCGGVLLEFQMNTLRIGRCPTWCLFEPSTLDPNSACRHVLSAIQSELNSIRRRFFFWALYVLTYSWIEPVLFRNLTFLRYRYELN